MKLLDLVKSAATMYRTGTSLHLVGPPGVGKSQTIKHEVRGALSAAYNEEFGYWDCLLPTIDAPDIRGFLVPTKAADGTPSSFFTRSAVLPPKEYLAKHPRGVFLLDERNAADMLTQKAVAPVVLERRFGEEYLPEGWLIVSASNRTSDRSGVTKPPKHLVNRERTLQIEPDVGSWAVWAEEHKVHPMMVAFAKQKPGVVFTDKVPDGDGAFCTPRSFASAAHLLADIAGVDSDGNPNMDIPVTNIIAEMVSGDIGDGACAELFAYLKVSDQLPTIQEIEADPTKAKCPTELSASFAAAQMCLHYARNDNMDKLWTYCERLPRELQVTTAKSLVAKPGGILLNSKALTSWVAKNKALINASNK